MYPILAKFSRAADSVPKGNTLQTIAAVFYPIMNACAQAYRSGVRLAKSSGFHDQSEMIPSVFVQSYPHHVWHLLGQRGSTFLLTILRRQLNVAERLSKGDSLE